MSPLLCQARYSPDLQAADFQHFKPYRLKHLLPAHPCEQRNKVQNGPDVCIVLSLVRQGHPAHHPLNSCQFCAAGRKLHTSVTQRAPPSQTVRSHNLCISHIITLHLPLRFAQHIQHAPFTSAPSGALWTKKLHLSQKRYTPFLSPCIASVLAPVCPSPASATCGAA